MPTYPTIPVTFADWDDVASGLSRCVGVDLDFARRRVRRLAESPENCAAVLVRDAGGNVVGFFGVHISEREFGGRKYSIGALDLAFVDPENPEARSGAVAKDLSRAFAENFEDGGRPLALFAYFEDSDWWHFRRSEGFESAGTGLTFRRPIGAVSPISSDEENFEIESRPLGDDYPGPRACRCTDDISRPLASTTRATRWVVSRNRETLGEAYVRDHDDHLLVVDWRCRPDFPIAANRLLRAMTSDGARCAYFRVWNPTDTLLAWLGHAGFHTFAGGSEPVLAVRSRLPSPRRRWLFDETYFTSGFAGEEPLNFLFPIEFRYYPALFDD